MLSLDIQPSQGQTQGMLVIVQQNRECGFSFTVSQFITCLCNKSSHPGGLTHLRLPHSVLVVVAAAAVDVRRPTRLADVLVAVGRNVVKEEVHLN